MSKKYIMKNGISVEVSDEIYKILKESDRKIKYVEHDLKETRYIIDRKKETVKEIPSREDSLDRLTALGVDFADSGMDFRESVTDKIMLEQALEKLSDEDAVGRGLAAYLHDENLDKKVYSIMPMVETRNGNLYGVAAVQSYGELDKAETVDLVGYISGQFSDGFGESLEQHPVTLGEDAVYISLWNSEDYYLKPESELFHDQKLDQTMGGLS